MKRRTLSYLKRQRALRQMFQFNDLKDLLMVGFQTSRSIVVKRDILETLLQLNRPQVQLARA